MIVVMNETLIHFHKKNRAMEVEQMMIGSKINHYELYITIEELKPSD